MDWCVMLFAQLFLCQCVLIQPQPTQCKAFCEALSMDAVYVLMITALDSDMKGPGFEPLSVLTSLDKLFYQHLFISTRM